MTKTTRKMFVLCLMIFTACGTIIGNGIKDPTNPNPDGGIDGSIPLSAFLQVIEEYNASINTDCGNFTEDDSSTQIEDGRRCIIHADQACNPSKYLLNKTNPDGSQFVSFVNVFVSPFGPVGCLVQVHTVSNVAGNAFNNTETCNDFTSGQIPELACEVGE